jgi:hypothetical protein
VDKISFVRIARLLQKSSVAYGANNNSNTSSNSNNALSNSNMKKKSVRKAVNLSELQRYFKAAEEAAREIMLEEAIHIQRLAETSNQVYVAGASDTEGVIQLTTLSSLPLKSPKRLIALQLANNNPAFRERFRQKLESSGGPIVPKNPSAEGANNNSSNSNDNHASSSTENNISPTGVLLDPGMGEPSTVQSEQDVHDMLAMSEIEKYLQTTSPVGLASNNAHPSSNNKPANTNGTNKRRGKKVDKLPPQEPAGGSMVDLDDFVANEQLHHSPDKSNDEKKDKKVRKPRKSKKAEDGSDLMDIDNNNTTTTSNDNDNNDSVIPSVPKKRGRRKKNNSESDEMIPLSLNLKPPFCDDFSDDQDDNEPVDSDAPLKSKQRKTNQNSNSQNKTKGGDGSIIKRRRKGELRVVVDGGLNLVGSAHKHNLHSLLGGGLSDMGPPTFNLDGTTNNERRSSQRLKSGAPLSSLSNLNTLSNLDSPYNGGRGNSDCGSSGDKHFQQHPLLGTNGELLLLGSGYGIDTPGTLTTTRGLFDLKTNGLLTSSGLGLHTGGGPESVRFDFDEVAAHFPSPRAGEHVKGSSPYRWSAGSTNSMNSGFFSFSDGMLSARNSSLGGVGASFGNSSNSLNPLAEPIANNNNSSSSFLSNPPSSSSKHRKAHRRSSDASEMAEGSNTHSSNNHNNPNPSAILNGGHQQQSSSSSSEGYNTTVFQSPVHVTNSVMVTSTRTSRRNNHDSRQDRSAMGEDSDNVGLMHPPDSSTRKRMALDFSDDLDTPTALKLALGAPGHL